MKRFSLVAISLFFAAAFAISANAQAGAAQPGAGKIGLVNTFLFSEDKPGAGITKYKNALTALDNEFKPVYEELKGMQTKYQNLAAEIQKMNSSTAPIAPGAIQTKVDEAKALEISIKRKQEDAKERLEKRNDAVVGPIYADIIKAMSEYAKSKGYAVILDGAKLEEAQILMGFDDRYDVTKDFITFYNARP